MSNAFLVIDGKTMQFDSIEQAEKELHINVIPEFGKYNIIEDVLFE